MFFTEEKKNTSRKTTPIRQTVLYMITNKYDLFSINKQNIYIITIKTRLMKLLIIIMITNISLI